LIFRETELAGSFLIELEPHGDERGYFARTFCRKEFEAHGLDPFVAQCNISSNRTRGILRGMHYQLPPHEEAKLVSCRRGRIFDVIVDLRPDSKSFLQHVAVTLDGEQGSMLYVPGGFAHGFLTLEDECEVFYQMSQFYQPDAARGLRWNDPILSIPWPFSPTLISERDRSYPDFDLGSLGSKDLQGSGRSA
jgi:dTDP-4-dehydrorhamnose 3,5-epimerase